MQRLRRPFIWFVLLTLVISMFPAGLIRQANAASAATYFIPDITAIRSTALLSTDAAAGANQITRSNVYTTNNPGLTITGAYSYVAKDTMKVKIEQLSSVPAIPTGVNWVTDSTHFTTGIVVADPNNANKFIASNLQLFSGFNKITFSGMQGGVERSDVFYVLYDKVPYVQNLKVFGSGSGAVNLNEGTQVVVDKQSITLQGQALNSTKVTVSINGGTPILSSLLTDGTFFTPALNLSSGLNNLTIVAQNASDSITIQRAVYYFDKNKPFTSMDLVYNSANYPILDKTATVTDNSGNTTAQIKMQVLVPYGANPVATDGVVTVNGTTVGFNILKADGVTIGGAADEVIIPGADGITPAYRLVTLITAPYNLQTDPVSGTLLSSQRADVTITYGSIISSAYNGAFKYLPGETQITDMKYLPDYDPVSNNNLATVTQVPLDGAEVDKADFYILATADKAPTTALMADYLPLGTKALTLTLVATVGNQQVYQVTGFSNGQQKVRFHYSGSTSSYNADISYVSKNYIYVANLYDGQTYTFDSRNTNSLKITGKYIGFENISNAQYFINGIDGSKLVNGTDGPDTILGSITTATPDFDLDLNISASGPLVFGENRIVFTGDSMDGAGNVRQVRKEIRIYIIDTNVSNITNFMPVLASPTREPFVDADPGDPVSYPAAKLANIFAVTPEFIYKTDKYVTSEKSYDLVLRGGGASTINLNLGTQLFFTSTGSPINLAAGTRQFILNGTFTFQGTTYYYDFVGDQKDFILRIRDIPFAAPGSHVYNLELVNSTGARTNQRLEIVREVSPYRILSPQPTVGNQIIVNKNFVRFDIEAEGATQVTVNKQPATKRPDMNNRFVYDFVGLKPDKWTPIKIEIVRQDTKLSDTVSVYYASEVAIDSQFMAEKPSTKYSVFNKGLELSFPKGTVLQSANVLTGNTTKFYPDNKILFGIADPLDGVVERKNDYGNVINVNPDARTTGGASTIIIPDYLVQRFNSTASTNNFSRVSDIYWINGGVGEQGNKGTVSYKPSTNGLAPYSIEGNFTEMPLDRKLVPSKRGTLKLKFDPSVVDEVGSTVTVFRYTDNGSWENVGGEVDTKNHTISVPFDEFGYYTVMKLRRGFADITNHPWARNYLNGLYSKGIMNNLKFDAFGADDVTTRGEFATLLVKGLNIPLNYNGNDTTFTDVVPGARSGTWDFEHIETAARAGIVTGLSDGFFGTDQPVTREQAAVMIARALKLKMANNDSKLQSNLAKAFTDSGSMDYYSLPAIDAVSKAKIMEGSPTTLPGQKKPVYSFNPKGILTRAEAGKIAVELLKKSTKIFPKNLS
ncbi:S-layer-like y domain-containing protein [Paenibacillus sediminis]|uniref:SLH domain-containing protein n=1 Tax=Paenibacillus sediminis TaxID=664909 RepID=A0ABS4H2D3_9BACL|nr:S-layer homology domain-containing protein [Paenibacillus sediminis]MBP1936680.1 hypothetical protein [Paenibacillus sediminis]